MALLLTITAAAPLTHPEKPSQVEETSAMSYLEMYGYLSKNGAGTTSLRQDSMQNALLEFQAFANLNMTGELDQDTLSAMQRPRCGVRDVFHSDKEAERKKRYALWRFKWRKPILTYQMTKYTNDMDQSTIDVVIREAFEMWEAVTNLKFERKETSGSKADIIILFARGSHGDISAFDGPGNVLAHAFSPTNGDVHFDDDEQWTHKTQRGTNLFYVAVHEIGHALGLLHSSKSAAIMAPFYRSYEKGLSLDKDDINGIVALYGEKNVESTTTSTTTASTTTPSTSTSSLIPPINPSQICDDPQIDAITTLINGTTLIFKGEYYYVLTEENNIMFSSPRNITDLHRSSTLGGIKSAFTFQSGTTILNAEGGSVYMGSSGQIVTYGRQDSSNSNASFVRTKDGYYYSLKDSTVCWRKKVWIFFTQPICAQISETWMGLPSNIDAAWQRRDGKIYFFKGESLYRYDDENDQFLQPNPLSIATWMGCPVTKSQDV